MEYLSTFALIAGLFLLLLASPGPNFFIITQLSMDGRKSEALAVAAGVATGSTLWAIAAILGLAAVLAHMSWIATVLKFAGAAYLVWYGLKLLLGAASGAAPSARAGLHARQSRSSAFRSGLLTSLTNPKSGVFWTSVFAATMPVGAPPWVSVTCIAIVALLSTSWHFGLAILLGSRRAQAAFGRIRRGLNLVCGAVLVGLGIRLGLAHET